MKKLLSLIGVCAACASVYAQSYDYPWAIGLYGGRTEYNGEWGNRFFDFGRNSSDHLFGAKFYGHGALTVDRYLNRNFDVFLMGSYGYWGSEYENQEFEAGLANANLNLKYKFPFIPAKYRIHPYVFVGAGARGIFDIDKPSKETSHVKEGFDPLVQGGIGIECRLTEHWSLRYIGAYGYGFSDKHDTKECGDFSDQQLLHSLGIVCRFPFKCPGTPKEAKVDSTGCPIDSDGDGVADYLDQCPDTPAEARGHVDEKGCPLDSDGDGVADYLDQCPGTPAAARGYVDEKGCPLDSDGDGIADYEDACPKVAGIAANNGCPEVKAEVLKVFKKALNGIQFESGKAKIKKNSYGILDQIVTIMKENPEYNLSIKGHTDNSGKADKNQVLSEDRANAVKDYLTQHGVEGSRMTAQGFGQDQPVANNKTAAGRALNRRVEFEVNFSKVVRE